MNRFRPLEDIIKYDGEVTSPAEPNRFKRVSSQANNIENLELNGSLMKNQSNSVLKHQQNNVINVINPNINTNNTTGNQFRLNQNKKDSDSSNNSKPTNLMGGDYGSENLSGNNALFHATFQANSNTSVKNITENNNSNITTKQKEVKSNDSLKNEINKQNIKITESRERYFSEQPSTSTSSRPKENLVIGTQPHKTGNSVNKENEPDVDTKSN